VNRLDGQTTMNYWAIGYDENWNRDIGFDVPATCDHPDCNKTIHRGVEHVCGGEPYGGDAGCGLYFCENHLEKKVLETTGNEVTPVCAQCSSGKTPFEPTPDADEWINYKQTSHYWAGWRTYHETKASS